MDEKLSLYIMTVDDGITTQSYWTVASNKNEAIAKYAGEKGLDIEIAEENIEDCYRVEEVDGHVIAVI